MAKFRRATGKKSCAISDRSGFRVRYTQLKTTWDNLRVEPEEWEPKHPQLRPPRNVIDAVALFDPRPDNDPENVSFFVGFNYDPFLDRIDRPAVGIIGNGFTGTITLDISKDAEVTGLAGTGSVGTETLELSVIETGLAGTGDTGTETIALDATGVSGQGGSGSVGAEALDVSIIEAGLAGTGGVGTEVPTAMINEAGLAGTGGVGDATNIIVNQEWGSGAWGEGAWGE